MRLELRRPLAFLDLESTGTKPAHDRIVEIAVLKLYPDGHEVVRCRRVNPGVPIPPDATALHGITDADVAGAPPFAAYAVAFYEFLDGCDFAGFGIRRFDLPLLRAEFLRAKQIEFSWRDRAVIDALAIFHSKHPRDLAAAVKQYCGHDFPQAHSAEEDVRATFDVLRAQLDQHADLPSDVSELDRVCNPSEVDWVDGEGRLVWVHGEATFAFGRHEGETLRAVALEAPDYLAWVLNGTLTRS